MKKQENCKHCGEQYKPNRFGVQKFCSNSCRSRYWYLKQNFAVTKLEKSVLPVTVEKKTKVEKMSLAGVGNAAGGATIVEIAKNIFTPYENKPATKKDIEELKDLLRNNSGYFPVHNLSPDAFGRMPYFDLSTGNIIYFGELNNPASTII